MKRKVIFVFYRLLLTLATPLVLVYVLLRCLRNRRYVATVRERCGVLPATLQQTVAASIWFHAVSVGEVLAAIPVLEELRRQTPGTRLFLSTGTLAGRETAEKRLAGSVPLVDGIFFAPFDFVWAVRRVLRRIRPSVIVVLETEIWPNLFREARRLGCGLILVNGRISDRALPRYRKFNPFFSPVLGLCDNILVQSAEMKARFEEAGAPPARVEIGGNLKYDFTPAVLASDSPVRLFLDAAPGQLLWIAASTSADEQLAEEDFVLAAQRALPGWRLIIAPRKPERFNDVARRLAASGLRWTRRSDLASEPGSAKGDPAADVLLLDSIGELSGLFSYSRVVFMGGTLADCGGHNILEPALFGKPVIAGPHLENFRDIAEHFDRHRALLRIAAGGELRDAVLAAAADPQLGERARTAADEKRGAASSTANRVMALYDTRYPNERRAQPAYAFLRGLSMLWRVGSGIDRDRKRARGLTLPVPVVSVGNITAGGTGKTPVAIALLREFARFKPALLTRGHGRNTGEMVILPAGCQLPPVSLTGDEARLCSRGTDAPVGIGADRHATGLRLLKDGPVGLIFLDDGMQHLQLKRDFEIVLIDALRPFGGGELLPLGRLREPLEGLARANAFLITRADEAPNTKAIEAVLRKYNPAAPVFRARTVPTHWVAVRAEGKEGKEGSDERVELDRVAGNRAVAFCGLGNPQSFWQSLERLGIKPLDRYAYDDHHRYTPAELRRLAQRARDLGADTLLTTAKDDVNLDAGYRSIIEKLNLYRLEIGIEIDRGAELFRMIADKTLGGACYTNDRPRVR